MYRTPMREHDSVTDLIGIQQSNDCRLHLTRKQTST